jgi:sugar phosphate isomerase/epimerase
MARYPRIHLAMDNTFASKRWTKPSEWASVIRSMGIRCIEASADTEADPFCCGEQYLSEWIEEVRAASAAHGVRVVSFFTGYTTYRTLGLAHPDARVRDRVMEGWLKVMARVASRVKAGLGFYIHAFPESVMQDPGAYAAAKGSLYDSLAEIARYADEVGGIPIIVEQMYSPHQIPWTIDGAVEYISEVSWRSGCRAYTALDTGHQSGQRRFLRPDRHAIERMIEGARPVAYLGPDAAYRVFETARADQGTTPEGASEKIEAEMDRYPYMFASERDGSLPRWLEEIACFSPVVHLQQTDGTSSSHRPFTPRYNETGIVRPLEVLKAIERSYEQPTRPNMPPRCEDIYLTFEIFANAAERPRDILPALAESVRYWRQWVPEDGIDLISLLRR